jgi:hypothetical protein
VRSWRKRNRWSARDSSPDDALCSGGVPAADHPSTKSTYPQITQRRSFAAFGGSIEIICVHQRESVDLILGLAYAAALRLENLF